MFGTIVVRILTPDNSFLSLRIDIVEDDVPFLLGLDIMDRERLVANNVLNRIESYAYGGHIPITRQFENLYVQWPASTVLFTRSELKKLH